MSTTWYDVQDSVTEWAKSDWLNGDYDLETVDDWAHETADGCEYVIYYHHQNALWSSSDYVQSFEDMVYGVDDTQQRIQACVYYAISEACLEAAYEAAKLYGVFTATRERRSVVSRGEVINITVPGWTYTNPNKK
jgi:hypothetical protein